MGWHPGPPALQKRYVLVHLRERGRPSPVFPVTDRIQFVASTDALAAPRVQPEAVQHLLCGQPSPTPRLYMRCPQCEARRLGRTQIVEQRADSAMPPVASQLDHRERDLSAAPS